MGVFNVPLGMNLTSDDPIKVSPFVYTSYSGLTEPPGPAEDLTTESGIFITTEDGDTITTE